MQFKHKVWHISGYAGWNDYDGVEDNNFNYKVSISDNVTKKEIEAMVMEKYKGNRTLCFKVEEVPMAHDKEL